MGGLGGGVVGSSIILLSPRIVFEAPITIYRVTTVRTDVDVGCKSEDNGSR